MGATLTTGPDNGGGRGWRRAWWLCAWALLGSLPASAAPEPGAAEVPVVLGTVPTARTRALSGELVTLVCREAGLKCRLDILPAERARQDMAAGRYPLEFGRYAGYERVVPGVIRIDPAVYTVRVVALVRESGLAAQGWKGLLGKRVAYMRGTLLAKERLQDEAEVIAVNSPSACVEMVAKGRVEACVLTRVNVPPASELPPQPTLHLELLETVPLHLWAAPGQQALADRMSSAVRALLQRGELQRFWTANATP
ncbi:MAG: transporter substrate-binding domain-containing protein [Roseateles sp.]